MTFSTLSLLVWGQTGQYYTSHPQFSFSTYQANWANYNKLIDTTSTASVYDSYAWDSTTYSLPGGVGKYGFSFKPGHGSYEMGFMLGFTLQSSAPPTGASNYNTYCDFCLVANTDNTVSVRWRNPDTQQVYESTCLNSVITDTSILRIEVNYEGDYTVYKDGNSLDCSQISGMGLPWTFEFSNLHVFFTANNPNAGAYISDTIDLIPGAGSSGDPHIRLGNGGKTDFRGLDKTYFNILSLPDFSFSAMTEDADFMLPTPQLVHGSFFTNFKFKIRENGQYTFINMTANKPGFYISNSDPDVCKSKNCNPPFPWMKGWEYNLVQEYNYKNLSVLSKPKTTILKWNYVTIEIKRSPVFNPLNNITGRFDFNIKMDKQSKHIHGLIGYSFWKKELTQGELDVYGSDPEFTTAAQAGGVIEGLFTDYIVLPIDHSFKYSQFDKPFSVISHGIRESYSSLTSQM